MATEDATSETKQVDESSIYNKPNLDFFEEFGHLALIGPTNAGKTTRIKIFFCDQKFKNLDTFIYVGGEKDLNEMAECFVAANYLNTRKMEGLKMKFYPLDKIEEAIAFCSNKENIQTKLLFIDDALLQGSKAIKTISNFISQAKNSNTTMIVTMHNSTGDNSLKNIRNACRYLVFLNSLPQEIKYLLNTSISDKMLMNYKNQMNKFDKFLIFDKEQNIVFDKKYKYLE